MNDYLYACRNVYGEPQPTSHLDSVQTFPVAKGMTPYSPRGQGIFRKPGLCPKCKKGRHWAKDCRSGNLIGNNLNRGFNTIPRRQIACYHCGKQGHIKRNCRFLINSAPQGQTYKMQGNAQWASPQALPNQGQNTQTIILPSPAQEN